MQKLISIFIFACLIFSTTPSYVIANNDVETSASLDSSNNSIDVSVNNWQTKCYGLDVVFIIDQSGSMEGEFGYPSSDPNNQREAAPEGMVDLLSDIALDQCPETIHRMALVSFGSDASVDLPLSDIDPETLNDALAIREKIKTKIVAKNMGQTNPQKAFQVATEILNGASPEGLGIRKRVIIYVTDGIPCVRELGCAPPEQNIMDWPAYTKKWANYVETELPFDPILLKQENCLRDLGSQYPEGEGADEDEVNQCMDEYRVDENSYTKSTYLYTILLRFRESYPQSLRETYTNVSEDHGGRVIDLSENRNEIPTTFRKILSELAGVRPNILQCGNFAVNPYLSKATITIYKLDPELKVKLSYLDAQNIQHVISGGQSTTGGFDLAEDYSSYSANERYVFTKPYPGIWRLEADNCDGLDAFYDLVQFDASSFFVPFPDQGLPQFDREPYFDADHPFYLEYQMRDTAGTVIPQADFEEFWMAFAVSITSPSGKVQSLDMKWVSDQQIYRSNEPMELSEPGEYKVAVIGNTVERQQPYSPVSDLRSQVFTNSRQLLSAETTFKVFAVEPFKIEITYPTEGAVIKPIHSTLGAGWPLKIQSIPIRARIIDNNGNPFPQLEDIITDIGSALEATITASGQTQVITLNPDPAVPGTYFGEFQEIGATGAHHVTLRLITAFNDHYRPLQRKVDITFTREDGPWNNPNTYRSILGILIAIAVILTILYFVNRTNPIRGMLVFQTIGGPIVAALPLNSGWNTTVIGSNKLGRYAQLGLRNLKARNKGKSQKPGGGSLIVGGSGQPAIIVDIETIDRRHFSLDLASNMPRSLAGTAFQVMYDPGTGKSGNR